MVFAGIPGLEPGMTGPESVVLPITPYPKILFCYPFRNCGAKVRLFSFPAKDCGSFFQKKINITIKAWVLCINIDKRRGKWRKKAILRVKPNIEHAADISFNIGYFL